MSRKDISKKLSLEHAQIRSILSDYRKAKQKCISICQQLYEQLPNKVHFDSVERDTTIKMDLLDLPGLVQLKNTLVKTLTQLFDLENELHTRKEKFNAKKQFGNIVGGQNLVAKQINKYNKANISLQEIDRRAGRIQLQEFEKEEEAKERQKFKQKNKQNSQEGRYNVPIYHAQEDSSQNKIDKISKYIASLKRNMKQHSNQPTNAVNSQTRSILLEEPIFTTMKEELERYRMREEEMQTIINNKIQEYMKNYISNLEVVHETKEYKIVKIYKDGHDESLMMESINNGSTGDTNKTHENLKKVIGKQILEEQETTVRGKEKEKVEMDFDSDYNVEEVVSRISQTLENSESRLRQLRDQRKKMLLDDEIWAQFEQI